MIFLDSLSAFSSGAKLALHECSAIPGIPLKNPILGVRPLPPSMSSGAQANLPGGFQVRVHAIGGLAWVNAVPSMIAAVA